MKGNERGLIFTFVFEDTYRLDEEWEGGATKGNETERKKGEKGGGELMKTKL